MFLPCPNCGFLVARVAPRRGGTEQRCPRCGQVLTVEDDAPADGAAPHHASILRRREPDLLPTPVSADADAAHAHPAARGNDSAPDDATPKRGGRYARPAQDNAHAVPGALRDSSNREAATGSTATAAPVIVQAQPTPPPAAQVHTAPPAMGAAPSFVRAPARTGPRGRDWPLLVGIVALAVVLALQLVLAQRDTLASQPRWRPLVESLCGVVGCDVPAWREPSAFAMLDRSVQPKPGAPGVLTARASFRNDARWPQPWPTLVLTLSDVDGVPLGRRAFTPDEYAGDGARMLMPGQSASVQLDVLEPTSGVVAFAFDFR
jgi:hypothetical protein